MGLSGCAKQVCYKHCPNTQPACVQWPGLQENDNDIEKYAHLIKNCVNSAQVLWYDDSWIMSSGSSTVSTIFDPPYGLQQNGYFNTQAGGLFMPIRRYVYLVPKGCLATKIGQVPRVAKNIFVVLLLLSSARHPPIPWGPACRRTWTS